jgi:hypothetical protein
MTPVKTSIGKTRDKDRTPKYRLCLNPSLLVVSGTLGVFLDAEMLSLVSLLVPGLVLICSAMLLVAVDGSDNTCGS